MAMFLHTMASKYGKLPSELLRDANTVDVKVFDTAVKYENYLREKQSTGREPAPRYSTDQLQAMMNSVKGMNSENKTKR